MPAPNGSIRSAVQVPAVATIGHPCASASSVTPLTRSRNSARSYGCRQMLPGKFAAYSSGEGVSRISVSGG